MTIHPCMSDPDESDPDRIGLIFSLTNTIYWCKIFKWAVSDSGSTGALQALGKSSILLRSTINIASRV